MNEPSAKRSVAATRAVNSAKRKGFGKETESNTVFFGGTKEVTSKATGDTKVQTTFAAEAFEIDLHAGVFAEIVGNALLVFARDSILTGVKMEDGQAQKRLKARAAAEERLTPFRGAKSGVLADGLRRGQVTGSTVRARTVIQPPTNRNVVIAKEAKRGNTYLGLGSATDDVIRLAVQTAIDAALESKLKAPEPEPTDAKKVDTR